MEQNLSPYGSIRSDDREKHREMVLHTLLEEKCIHSAMEELNVQGVTKIKHARNVSSIMSLADEKYQFMCKHLGAVGLVSTDLNAERFTNLRQGYRHGLDFLSKAISREDNEVELSALADALQKAGNEQSVNILQHDAKALAMISNVPQSTSSTDTANMSLSPVSAALQSLISHPVLDISRYRRDFLELKLIGKGGYGKVFSVQHRLDGLKYAVKKIVLSMSSIRKIEREGCSRLDRLLQELRTLAKMDHPNIVRYFSGWLEYSVSEKESSLLTSERAARKRVMEKDCLTDSSVNTISFNAQSAEEGQPETFKASSALLEDIIFENSGPARIPLSEVTGNKSTDGSVECDCLKCNVSTATNTNLAGNKSSIEYSDPKQLGGIICKKDPAILPAENTDINYDYTESSKLTSGSSINSEANVLSYASGPSLILHIQMSLHPFTLADFIEHVSPIEPKLPPNVRRKGHCFHAFPSLQILLTLMDGVQYLHRQGIIHRDIKPANVFLDISAIASQQTRCIDLSVCFDCHEEAINRGQETCKLPAYLNARIGDFGLVAAISQSGKDGNDTIDTSTETIIDPSLLAEPDARTSKSRTKEEEKIHDMHGGAVGTHLYKPPLSSAISMYSELPGLKPISKPRYDRVDKLTEKLDVYAMGIILLELLCPFTTKMERYTVLTDVRRGKIPDDIRAWKCNKYGQELKSLLSGMLLIDESRRLGCEEIRRRAESILLSMERVCEEVETKR